MVKVLRKGKLVYELPNIEAMRKLRLQDIDRLDPGVKRLIEPHLYHVSLTPKLWNLKEKLIKNAKK
ncbi:MAG: hypothetical protein KGY75_00915 [Candidatus Cloacimonetes bacterium]|nr:hypothetical protein [Candidatus Cloacimonadota bacterium]MBS3766677.1 hypothetical protein [Candidatus Cloacimonadota bacterium]